MSRITQLALIVAVCVLQAGDRVSVKSPGAFARQGEDWWILVTVEPNDQNRLLIVEADGGLYRRSDEELSGKSPKVRQVHFASLAPGCYVFAATVIDADRRIYRSVAAQRLAVIGRMTDGNPCED